MGDKEGRISEKNRRWSLNFDADRLDRMNALHYAVRFAANAESCRERDLSVEAPRDTSLLRYADEPLAFDLTAQQREILHQAARFARRELYPLAERMDAEEYWPEEAFPRIGEAGFFGVMVPEIY